MTLIEAGEIFDYWRDSPPAYLMTQTVAAMLGWKPEAAAAPDALLSLAAAPPPGLALVAAGGLAMPAPVFDITAMRARNQAHRRTRGAGDEPSQLALSALPPPGECR